MRFIEERIGEVLKQLERLRYRDSMAVTDWEYFSSTDRIQYNEITEELFDRQLPAKGRWGGTDKYYAFRKTVEIPEQFAGKELLFALTTGREGLWDATNPQFLLCINGKIAQGLDVNHQDSPIGPFEKGEHLTILLVGYTGEHVEDVLLDSSLVVIDRQIERFYYDLLIPYQVACLQEKEEKLYWDILNPLNEAVNRLDLRENYSRSFFESLKEASDYLQQEFYEKKNTTEEQGEVYCVGHTHIDVAWLWTLAVTRDKAVRSFSTVVKLMEQHPDYIFMSSQPQLYQYVKESAPETFARIKDLVAQGRWEVEGGMWLEPDCNLSSGESFVRQFLYGKRFFKEEFGKDNQILWLPDVFGYSAALPQIMEKSGIRYFMTTKISWNETNKMPYDSFYWEGIDGTKILTHFICTRDYESPTRHPVTNTEHTTAFSTNYNGYTHPSQVKGAWQRYQQKDLNKEVLLSYGYGDGGGGTTNWMIESVERMNRSIPGIPKTRFSTATNFFKALEGELGEARNAPLWTGELYLEYHRATYTSMARNKRFNRKCEFLLGNAELLSVLSGHYDRQAFQEAWILLLRNQFHDILPGSCIEEVYTVSRQEYEALEQKIAPLLEQMDQEIADQVQGQKGDLILYNYNGMDCQGLVTVEPEVSRDWNVPAEIVTQQTEEGKLLFQSPVVPGKGYFRINGYAPLKTAQLKETDEDASGLETAQLKEIDGNTLSLRAAHQQDAGHMLQFSHDEVENQYYHIRFNEKGQMTSFYDKEAERELIQENTCGNVFMTYEDKPHDCDNWNLYEYYKEKSWEVDQLVKAEIVEEGPLRYGICFTYQYLSSTIEERLFFYPNQRNVDMDITIDWKEDQIFLKLLYPVKLHTKEATFEIQYGNVKRNMIKNTSWDRAKFEVCMHKWMDISESDSYGISFINDCKYGVSVEENVVGLSLIKSGMYPNPKADREMHHLLYSIYPHMGDYRQAKTVERAYLLNNPLQAVCKHVDGGEQPEQYGYVSTGAENVIAEVVKPAEDGQGTIVRLYEAYGRRTKAEISFAEPASTLYLVNMMEEEEKTLELQDGKLQLWFNPFEIVTLKVMP